MPITTQMITKGVPPRVHKPKGKAKAKPQASRPTGLSQPINKLPVNQRVRKLKMRLS